MSDVTRILHAMEQGDPCAAEELLPAVYHELRRLAAQKLAQELPGQTLQATALVHEAYIRLVHKDQDWNSRGHFFTAAAEAMRRILIENARRKKSLKYGGDRNKMELHEEILVSNGEIPSEDLLALDEALHKFSQKDPLSAELVKLRFFTGLTGEQAAKVLGISHNTADKYWKYARSWLRVEIAKGDDTEAK